MYEEMFKKLNLLKRALHPEKQINIIDQCEIVAQAAAYGSPYENDLEGIATYLEISKNKVYKMSYTAKHMIPELKEWFRETEYQGHTAYDKATLSPEAQREFLRNIQILETGRDSLSQTITKEEK